MNLIVDTNYCFHLDYYQVSKGKNPLGTLSARTELIKAVAARIFSVVETLPIQKVILCADSKSWRKEFYSGYKSSRSDGSTKGQMDEATKKSFYDLIEEFCDIVKKKGVIKSKVPTAEGDDLLFLWSKKLNEAGENCVIMSGDRDSVQLVSPSSDGIGWTVVWTNTWKNQTFYVPSGWKNKQADVFSMTDTLDESSLQSLAKDLFATVTEMSDPSSIVLGKVLLGDDGDDVPAVWDNGERRLTPKKAEAVFEYVKKKGLTMGAWPIISKDMNLLNELSGAILRTMSAVDGEAERAELINSLRRNERLVWMDRSTLPASLLREFERHQEEVLLEAEQVRRPDLWSRSKILQDSRFDGKSSPKSHDPFAFIDLPI